MLRRSIFALLGLSFAIASCSSFGGNNTRKVTIKRKDVPHQARKNFLGEPRKRILVLPVIDAERMASPKVTRFARDVVVKRLLRTDQFVVIRNSDFPQDVHSFRVNDTYELEKMAKVANGVGISAIVEARILSIKARRIGDEVGLVRKVKARMEVSIQVRMVGTDNQKILMTENRSAVVEDSTTRFGKYASSDRFLRDDPKLVRLAVQKAFNSVIPPIIKSVRKLSWEGRIAHITGDQVYINAGRISGLQIGDLLKVVDEGRDIFDPETGDYIGHAPGRMKGTLEIVSYFGKDGAITVVHSGSGFKPLDRVEIY